MTEPPEVASESYFIQDEILSTSGSSVQKSSSVQGTCSAQESSGYHLENLFTAKPCDQSELLLNDDASSLCLSEPLKCLVFGLSLGEDNISKLVEDELSDIIIVTYLGNFPIILSYTNLVVFFSSM